MPGLMRGVARTAVVAGTATAVSNRVSRRQASRWAQQDAEQYPSVAPPPTRDVAPTPSQATKLEELRALGELKSSGVLTDAEFEMQKAQILAS
jgi:Short C-terminal domain